MKLRPYQMEDVAELLKHDTHGVFNEQRTGKTPTSIVAMDQKAEGRIVVVCPASMQAVWRTAFMQWTTRPSFMADGTPEQRAKMIDLWGETIDGTLILSYDTFKQTKNREGEFLKITGKKPKGAIVDECHRAVGRSTQIFSALKHLRYTKHRLYLSGTPAPNHPSQVWSILHFIDPKTFTSYWRFVEEFFFTEEQRLPYYVAQKSGVTSIQQPLGFKPDKEQEYVELLAKYSIMRKRKDVMPWLKDVPVNRILLPAATEQLQHLESLTKFFKVDDIYAQGTLDQLIRTRQICQDPRLLGLKGKGPKTTWIKSYVSDYPDKAVLIFTRFAEYAKLLKKELGDGAHLYTGETKNKQELIDAFQFGAINVLIIQIDAGKEGITLDRADVSIFADIYPPVTDIQQARDRLVATSHERNTEKEIIELVLEGTYDEAIYTAFDQGLSITDLANNYIHYLQGGI